ncbi:unnamed protein product [Parnassius mnemosyne]|uniref:Chitin-binding type-4 domain-containing protein n=1 Tax=Parnassius mnemosyne TaxID=213953 RepID=A0AAV1L3F7_9NEOP
MNTYFYLFQILCCLLAVQGSLWAGVSGHGRLIEPPSRASAWRFGFDTPPDYNDNQSYCGGFTRQWTINNGKCGVCGDPWDSPIPRAHELGGRFGKGVIVRRYARKETIVIKVQLTASHMGYFEFRVCEEPKATTQECLDKNVLIDNNNETRYYPKHGSVVYEMKYKLPDKLECSHCVLQWRYIAGNNWGPCPNGTSAVGCGPQEEFRACADITIGDSFTTSTRRSRPTYVPPIRKPNLPAPEESTGSAWYGIVIAIVTLFVALIVLSGICLFYYRGSMRIKSLLKSKAAPRAPVPPPRHKRLSLSREQPPVISSPRTISDAGLCCK